MELSVDRGLFSLVESSLLDVGFTNLAPESGEISYAYRKGTSILYLDIKVVDPSRVAHIVGTGTKGEGKAIKLDTEIHTRRAVMLLINDGTRCEPIYAPIPDRASPKDVQRAITDSIRNLPDTNPLKLLTC